MAVAVQGFISRRYMVKAHFPPLAFAPALNDSAFLDERNTSSTHYNNPSIQDAPVERKNNEIRGIF
jgi:hypothetical protein